MLCGRATADHLKRLFPTSSHEAATKDLIGRFEAGAGDHAHGGKTELWIAFDRPEEALWLRALTHLDAADQYRRQIGGELRRTGWAAA